MVSREGAKTRKGAGCQRTRRRRAGWKQAGPVDENRSCTRRGGWLFPWRRLRALAATKPGRGWGAGLTAGIRLGAQGRRIAIGR